MQMDIYESKQKFKRVDVSLDQDDIEDAVHEYIKKKHPHLVGMDIEGIDWTYDEYADDGRGTNVEFAFRLLIDDTPVPEQKTGCGACTKNCGGC
jgi:hypothetical protein